MTLRDRISERRDALFQNKKFLDWSSRFPLFRPFARRYSRDLFDLVAGFIYSQTLDACLEAGLLERLAEKPATLEDIATDIGLGVESTRKLLCAAQGMDLIETRSAGRYGLGRLGGPLLANPGVQAMIRHHRLLYADLAKPLDLLRDTDSETALSRYWAYARSTAPQALSDTATSDYSELMDASQDFFSQEVLDAYAISRHACVLDVGGGEGRFVMAAASHAPQTRFMLFDVPAVAERANAAFAQAGIDDRAQAFGGDFFNDPLPTGADLITLNRIVHDHDDAAAMRILAQARTALKPGASIMIAEPMAEMPGAERVGTYFSFYLAAMRSGRPRTAAELCEMLVESGFADPQPVRTNNPLLTAALIAKTPDL